MNLSYQPIIHTPPSQSSETLEVEQPANNIQVEEYDKSISSRLLLCSIVDGVSTKQSTAAIEEVEEEPIEVWDSIRHAVVWCRKLARS